MSVGKGLFYRDGRDIRRQGSGSVYASFTRQPKLDAIATMKLIGLLNGDVCSDRLHFQLLRDGRTVICSNLETGDRLTGFEFMGNHAARTKVILDRLERAIS
jgi:hypothetical protein